MSVREIQTALKKAGFDPGPIDGIMGNRTRSAIRAFQEANNLKVDGVVGSNTTAALKGTTTTTKEGATTKTGTTGKKTVRQYLEANFPSFLWAIDHPEIGPILKQSAKEEWESLRIQGALQGTTWWQTTAQSARQAILTQRNDPATWKRMQAAKREDIQTELDGMGLKMTQAQITSLVNDSLTYSYTPAQVQSAIIANSNFNRIKSSDIEKGDVAGVMAATENEVQRIADEHLMRLSARDKMYWIREIAQNHKSMDSFQNYAQTMALKRMPFLQDMVASGLSPREALRPYQNTIGEMLEKPPASIDFADDRYQKVIVGEGGTLATTSAMKKKVREEFRHEWDQTANAQQSAARTTAQIAEIFGRRA